MTDEEELRRWFVYVDFEVEASTAEEAERLVMATIQTDYCPSVSQVVEET